MNNTEYKETEIKALIDKAASTQKSEDAIRFSQAACNAANAVCAMISAKQINSTF